MTTTLPASAVEEPVAGTVWRTVRLRPDASVHEGGQGLVLRCGRFRITVARPTPGTRAVLADLQRGWVPACRDAGAPGGQAQVVLTRLDRDGWLSSRLAAGGRLLLESTPRALGAAPTPAGTPAAVCLSRFATVSVGGSGPVLRSPLSGVDAGVPDPAVLTAVLASGRAPSSLEEFARNAGLDLHEADTVLDALVRPGLLVSPRDRQREDEPPLVFWTPEELAVQVRSRMGDHATAVGATYRLRGRVAPEPAALQRPGGIALAAPAGRRSGRRSERHHDDSAPVSTAQLSEFLHRVHHLADVRDASGHEVAARPYPSGGSLAELEIYPVVRKSADLEPGAYWYDSSRHRLQRRGGSGPDLDRLLDAARAAAAVPAPPQVLLVVTARVARVAWKYEGLAYSLMLRDAGVLLQQMYLTAAELGLAGCALGAGDSAAFCRLAALDPLSEPAVADFTLGSRSTP